MFCYYVGNTPTIVPSTIPAHASTIRFPASFHSARWYRFCIFMGSTGMSFADKRYSGASGLIAMFMVMYFLCRSPSTICRILLGNHFLRRVVAQADKSIVHRVLGHLGGDYTSHPQDLDIPYQKAIKELGNVGEIIFPRKYVALNASHLMVRSNARAMSPRVARRRGTTICPRCPLSRYRAPSLLPPRAHALPSAHGSPGRSRSSARQQGTCRG